MSMRIFNLCALSGALAACGGTSGASGEPEGPSVDCAIGPGSDFSDACTIEHVSAEAFVIHHPDGGFRRFIRGEDSTIPLLAADGAEPLTYQNLAAETGMLEFGVAVDRYRLELTSITPAPDE